MYVYKITNSVNGKMYVGLTKNSIEKRFYKHVWDAFSKKDGGSCVCIANAIVKYGKENFKIELVQEYQSFEDLSKGEKYWINTLNTKTPNGYNIKDGGHNGWVHSEATRKKMGLKNTGRAKTESELEKLRIAFTGDRNPFFGKNHTKESIDKANASRKIKRDTTSPEKRAEWIKKAALSRTGQKRSASSVINIRNAILAVKYANIKVKFIKSPNSDIWALKSLNNSYKEIVPTARKLYKLVSGETLNSMGWTKATENDLNNCNYVNICWDSFKFIPKTIELKVA